MEALIPAPADCEVQSVIKFLNSQGIATDTRIQSKAHGVSIDISAAVMRYHDDGNEFLDGITTGDETWVAYRGGSPIRVRWARPTLKISSKHFSL